MKDKTLYNYYTLGGLQADLIFSDTFDHKISRILYLHMGERKGCMVHMQFTEEEEIISSEVICYGKMTKIACARYFMGFHKLS